MSYQNLQYGLGDRKPSADEGYTSLMRDGQGDNTYATVDDAAKRQSRGSSIGSHGYVKLYAEGTGTGGTNAGGAGAGAAAGAGGAALAGTAGLLAGSMADVRYGAFFFFVVFFLLFFFFVVSLLFREPQPHSVCFLSPKRMAKILVISNSYYRSLGSTIYVHKNL